MKTKKHYRFTLLERRETSIKRLVDAEAFEEFKDEPVVLPKHEESKKINESPGLYNFVKSILP